MQFQIKDVSKYEVAMQLHTVIHSQELGDMTGVAILLKIF